MEIEWCLKLGVLPVPIKWTSLLMHILFKANESRVPIKKKGLKNQLHMINHCKLSK